MGGASGWFEVIVLAAIAGFVAWRLFSVLGSRTGHEAPPVERRPLGDDPREVFQPRPAPARPAYTAEPKTFVLPDAMDPALQQTLREIGKLDTRFDPDSFLNGAKAAYVMILEHFWRGDVDSLKSLLGDDAHFAFAQAINTRMDGHRILNNYVSSISSAVITGAEIIGATAHISVRFTANILSDGATSMATDDWTFSRHTRSDDPNWLLLATDDSLGA